MLGLRSEPISAGMHTVVPESQSYNAFGHKSDMWGKQKCIVVAMDMSRSTQSRSRRGRRTSAPRAEGRTRTAAAAGSEDNESTSEPEIIASPITTRRLSLGPLTPEGVAELRAQRSAVGKFKLRSMSGPQPHHVQRYNSTSS